MASIGEGLRSSGDRAGLNVASSSPPKALSLGVRLDQPTFVVGAVIHDGCAGLTQLHLCSRTRLYLEPNVIRPMDHRGATGAASESSR